MERSDIHIYQGSEWKNSKIGVCDVSGDVVMAIPVKTELANDCVQHLS
jgi:hypothetical protein